MSKKLTVNIFMVCILAASMGCKQSTSPSPSAGSNSTGTLIFGTGLDEIASSVLGSDATTSLFQGDDAAFTSDGRVVYNVLGEYNANDDDQIFVASLNGSNAQAILNLQTSIMAAPAHAKMSPDGRYISFNYLEDVTATLGTHYGTLIYTSGG